MLGESPDWGGVLGAILKIAQTPDPSQNGLQALNNLTSNSYPISPKVIGNFFAQLVAAAGPDVQKIVLVGLVLFFGYMARDLIAEVAGRTARLILGLPDSEPLAFLELTFPADTEKSAAATRRLYSLLESSEFDLNWLERLAAVPKRYSLELTASPDYGIRYILGVPESELQSLHLSLLSYLPGLKIRQIEDYLPNVQRSKARIAELKFSGDPVLPLRGQGELAVHDPVDFIAGQMGSLDKDDLIAYQIVLSPISRVTHPKVEQRRDQFLSSISRDAPITPLLKKPVPGDLLWARVLLWLIEHSVGLILTLITKALLGAPSVPAPSINQMQNFPLLTRREEELSNQVFLKINDSLFAASIRILVIASDKKTTRGRLNAVFTAFRLFSTRYQSLSAPFHAPKAIKDRKLQDTPFALRALSAPKPMPQMLLGVAELADLYHFPNTSTNHAPQYLKTRSTELPMPLAFKNAMTTSDAQFGSNLHSGTETPIRIPRLQRSTHTYILGRTRAGKSSLLTGAITDDIQAGRAGVAVIDPHGDLANHLTGVIPPHLHDKVVVFNPADRSFPVGINILSPGIKFKDEIEAHDRITSAVISIFQKLTDPKYWGPHMEDILRHATLTTLKTKNPNLFTLQRLLTDPAFMQQTAQTLDDPVLRQFWQTQMAQTGDWQLTKYTSPLTSRLGRFIASKLSRHILLQPTTTLSIEDIMDSGKILLVNLSKGTLGEDQSSFFGSIITSLIWMASLARADIPQADRRPFYLYIDEFQNFATHNFSDIISEGRKFGIALTLAHQSVSQIDDPKILDVIASNAGTMITFTAGPTDEKFIQPFMAPVVSPGDITNLPPHHFFILAKDIEGADVFTGVARPMEQLPKSDKQQAAAVIARSQTSYGTPRHIVDQYLDLVFAGVDQHKKRRRRRAIKHLKKHSKKAAKSQTNETPRSPESARDRRTFGFEQTEKVSPPAVTQNKANSRPK